MQLQFIVRKVVRKNAHELIPKGNMGYDQYIKWPLEDKKFRSSCVEKFFTTPHP